MMTRFLFIVTCCTLLIQSLPAQQSPVENPVLVEKDGIQLRTNHLQTYLFMAVANGEITADPSEETILLYATTLGELFNNNPSGTIQQLDLMATQLGLTTTATTPTTPSPINPESTDGHQFIRNKLGADIGQMNFHSTQANQFRQYLYNSLLYTSDSNFSGDVNGNSYTSSSGKILFCPDGSYAEVLSGNVSIDVPGMSASSGGDDTVITGYWEVATLPNGTYIILFYSTHPWMLEDSPTGFLPFPVGQYSETEVLFPNGDGYRRIGNQSCSGF